MIHEDESTYEYSDDTPIMPDSDTVFKDESEYIDKSQRQAASKSDDSMPFSLKQDRVMFSGKE